MSNLIFEKDLFANRHIGPDATQTKEMLATLGLQSLPELIDKVVPGNIRLKQKLANIPSAETESEFLLNFKKLAAQNQIFKSYIGMGYYDTITPAPILRNILENPGWYTAYTPYQAEIAQGRLEALINYQTMVTDLTGMELANASLLDEATAAAEAMSMLYALRKPEKKNANVFLVSDQCHPQVIDVLITRSAPIGIKIEVAEHSQWDITRADVFAFIAAYPGTDGEIHNFEAMVAAAKEHNVFTAFCTDLLALTLLTPPGEWGADVVVGSSQRFGVPMGYGGPHAAFFATKEEYKRFLPGRIIGVSIDSRGKKAYRMALQTREQHIKREKATSNICTAQVLLSVMAGMYAVYHGPTGLKRIAQRTAELTLLFKQLLEIIELKVLNKWVFDTITFEIKDSAGLRKLMEDHQINLRYHKDGKVSVSFDETTTVADVQQLFNLISAHIGSSKSINIEQLAKGIELIYPKNISRSSSYLTHPVFNTHHSEHEITRYMKQLENKDLSLVHSMIALGSCTMKLNATSEMIPVTWPEFGKLHPFAPLSQAKGYTQMMNELSTWLCSVTGFHAVSLQPNSGAQGEYTGLMVIRAYHLDRGEAHRNIALIPTSAHGTNPASAVMAGMKVVLVACDERGNVNVEDLKAKAEAHKDNLAALMVTYPSTHGVFEEAIQEICQIIHERGGLVYMDGANMNAQVGLTSPGNIGADVCHLNLHKTFCIPHGGGGPGMGSIGVVEKLAPYLPGHCMVPTGGSKAITAVSAAPFGSASILTISYAYIRMMGAEGITKSTEYAILNANYIMKRLEPYYPVLYTGSNGFCAHEMILDMRGFKLSAGIEVEDIAKRLMDYGFHAPTVSFPVGGTIMIEPTESEPKEELDRFCEAMIAIREEIAEIENGIYSKENNVLKNAPHTADILVADVWELPYSREKAAYPLPWIRHNKFWPSVGRIDGAYGDRNLMCSCIPVEEYARAVEQELS